MGCCSTCAPGKKIVGHIIFKPIEVKLLKTNKKELDDLFSDAERSLLKAENLRQTIALKFKNMIVETGVCVLKNPNLERVIISFFVLILVNIIKEAKNDYEKISKIDFKKIFELKKEAPFISLNEKTIGEIRDVLKLDLLKEKTIQNSSHAIKEFIESLFVMKDYFLGMKKEIFEIYSNSAKYVNEVRKELTNYETNHITLKEAKDYLAIGEKNLEHIIDLTQLTTIILEFLVETVSAVKSLENFLWPGELARLHKLAKDAVKNKIFDPKEIVFTYSKHEKCKQVSKWEENICYKEEADELLF